MSGLLNTTLNGSSSNPPDSNARQFATPFSTQSAAASGFHHSGMQGIHNIHGGYNMVNIPPSLTSRNSVMGGGVPSSVVQQLGGSISSGRFASNNLPVAVSQVSHGSSHGLGVASRGGLNIGAPGFNSGINGVGGSIPGISSSTSTSGNRNTLSGLGMTPILGNVGHRLGNSLGNIVNTGNTGRSISSGGLPVAGLASRVNLANNSGSGNLGLQGPNRLMSGMLQQAPQIVSMLGSSYLPSGGPLSQSHLQTGISTLSSLSMLSDVNSNDNSPFDLNDFPQLNGRPSSAGGPQSQLGSLRKQGVGVSSIVQQNQEFSIQNEDFPALPGYKGSSDFSIDLQQKDLLHENMSLMQSPHYAMSRSGGFDIGAAYSANRQQQHAASGGGGSGVPFSPGNNQDLLHLHGTDIFPLPHGGYHSQVQNSGLPSIGLRPLNSPNPGSSIGGYDKLIQQYQHQINQPPFRLQQMSAAAQSMRDTTQVPPHGTQTSDRFGLRGLISVLGQQDNDLSMLALGIDLTSLGLSLNSNESLYKTFASPWSNEPARGEPEFSIPDCYYAKPTPPLQPGHFQRLDPATLFYIFYSMPRDEAQLYAAHELYSRGWVYHKDNQSWLTKIPNTEPLLKTQTYERGSYTCFDPSIWNIVLKDNFVLHYDDVEKSPALPAVRPQAVVV